VKNKSKKTRPARRRPTASTSPAARKRKVPFQPRATSPAARKRKVPFQPRATSGQTSAGPAAERHAVMTYFDPADMPRIDAAAAAEFMRRASWIRATILRAVAAREGTAAA
jgi:hypothetical protein